MGSAVSTAQQPLAEVDIKNDIGVLYGEEAQQAFAAAKEDDVVAWPKVQVYAEAHGLLDPKAVLFKNLQQFKIARDQIEAIYDEHFSGAVRDIPWRGKDLGDDRRQCAPCSAHWRQSSPRSSPRHWISQTAPEKCSS